VALVEQQQQQHPLSPDSAAAVAAAAAADEAEAAAEAQQRQQRRSKRTAAVAAAAEFVDLGSVNKNPVYAVRLLHGCGTVCIARNKVGMACATQHLMGGYCS